MNSYEKSSIKFIEAAENAASMGASPEVRAQVHSQCAIAHALLSIAAELGCIDITLEGEKK